jgi:UbiD family decarboxylase
MTYRDLRAFLDALEARGKLYKVTEPIDKDSELLPLVRLQLRGLPDADRRVLVFENVRNAAGDGYDMGVAAGVYGISEEILALGIGCESPDEMLEKWHEALENPIPPRIVESGPVQEEVHLGADLLTSGLHELPVPVEEPGFSQLLRTGMPMITRDPESGIRNVGTYNAFLYGRDRLVAGIAGVHDALKYHWQTARQRNEELPLAVVIGATPNVMLVGSAAIPYGMDELAVAGGLVGEPVELVACKTIPLEVPAHAEIVIEGMLSTREFEPRLAFGEYPGYLSMEHNNRPVMRVTAITHRKQALFTPMLVGFPPNDSSAIWGFCNAAMLYHGLRHACRFPVDNVFFPHSGGGYDFCIVRLEKDAKANPWQILSAAAGLHPGSKYIVLVDHDVNPRDPDLITWALSYRVRPESDISIQRGRSAGLDPSLGPTGASRGRIDPAGHPSESFRVLIDATMRGPYPPVALPRQEYMNRALEIWRQHPALPELRLLPPWYGYPLGYWSAEEQDLADRLVHGDYDAAGRLAAERRVTTEQIPDTPHQ